MEPYDQFMKMFSGRGRVKFDTEREIKEIINFINKLDDQQLNLLVTQIKLDQGRIDILGRDEKKTEQYRQEVLVDNIKFIEEKLDIPERVKPLQEAVKKNVELVKLKTPLSKMNLKDLFLLGSNVDYPLQDVTKELLSRIKKPNESDEIKQLKKGPLQKSKYTGQFEELIEAILVKNTLKVSPALGKSDEWIIEDTVTKKKYNINEIVKNIDLRHLVIKPEFFDKYVEFVKSTAKRKPSIIAIGVHIPTPNDFKNRDPENINQALEYAEKLAINIYTGQSFTEMSRLLRGIVPIDKDGSGLAFLEEMLLHIAFCASGLNKIPVKTFDMTFRGEPSTANSKRRTEERKKAVEMGTPVLLSGFVSTTPTSPSGHFVGDSAIIFTNGVLGRDIQSLSAHPEGEVLLLPTHVILEGYATQDGFTVFQAKTVWSPDLQLREKPEEKPENHAKKSPGLH